MYIKLIVEKYLKRTNSFVRFLLVGIVNTCVGLFIIFFLLNVIQLSYWTSTFTGNAIGACVSYLLNRTYTFRSKVRYQKGIPRFFAVILSCYFASYYLSERLMEWMSQFHLISSSMEQSSAVLLGSALYTISNYFAQKYFVFHEVTTA